MMSPAQKQMIEELRRKGMGYGAVAKQMNLPLNTIKTFCRRHNLASNMQESTPVCVLKPHKKRSAPKPKKQMPMVLCEVTVSYNEDASAAAVADVMQTLMQIQGR